MGVLRKFCAKCFAPTDRAADRKNSADPQILQFVNRRNHWGRNLLSEVVVAKFVDNRNFVPTTK